MRPKRRNTPAYTFMAWTSFALVVGIFAISVFNADWVLMEKGLYVVLFLWGIFSAFTLQKVIRDNAEDEHDYPQLREERLSKFPSNNNME